MIGKINVKGRKRAFTLAETLITLAIIGVVLFLTIPTLIQSIQKHRFSVALQKSFSVISLAYGLLQSDGLEMTSAFPGTDTGTIAMNYFATKLSVLKNCGSSSGCWYNTSLRNLNGSVAYPAFDTSMSAGKVLLADGSLVLIMDDQTNCTTNRGLGALASTCGSAWIDVNGNKGPNILGRDVFMFWITKNGIFPPDENDCNPTSFGSSCAVTIITQGMTY